MKRTLWHRTYNSLVDDERIRLLAFEDRWHNEALKCLKGQGLLDCGDDATLLRRKVAVKLGVQLRELDEIARRLGEVGLIDPETLQPAGWHEEQFISDVDRTAAERKRRQRARERSNNQSLSDVTERSRVTSRATDTVTIHDVTRTDTENRYISKTTTETALTWDALPQFDAEMQVVAVNQLEELAGGTRQDVLDELAGALRANAIKGQWPGWLHGVARKAREGKFKPNHALAVQAERERRKPSPPAARRNQMGLPPPESIASPGVVEARMAAIRQTLSLGAQDD